MENVLLFTYEFHFIHRIGEGAQCSITASS